MFFFCLGKVIFPGTGYLYLAWKAYGNVLGIGSLYDETPVKISDIRFLRATIMNTTTVVIFSVIIQCGTGHFEITESGTSVCTGYISRISENTKIFSELPEIKTDAVVLQMNDFYKESRIKGYNFEDDFVSVLEVRSDGEKGKIRWSGSIIPFIDGMMQMDGITYDSRASLGITGIDCVLIDPKRFAEAIKTNEDGIEYVDVRDSKRLGIIQADGIEIQGTKVNVLPMSKLFVGEPVLESYKFIPYHNCNKLSVAEAIRVLVQLWLENVPILIPKIVEIGSETEEPLITYVQKAIDDIPLITPDMTLLTTKADLEVPEITVEHTTELSENMNCSLILTTSCCALNDKLDSILSASKETVYIISREKSDFDASNTNFTFQHEILSTITVEDHVLVLIKYKREAEEVPFNVVEISKSDDSFDWMAELKEKLKEGKVCLVAQNDSQSGIVGLVNCLKREPKIDVTCVFINDPTAPDFDVEIPFYKDQLNKNLAINVYSNGNWGSYRHLSLIISQTSNPQKGHCFANTSVKGDLSSMQWFNGPLDSDDPDLIAVQYSALNFKDVMIASGKMDLTPLYPRLQQDCIIGFEYSGVKKDGKKVMGMVGYEALATYVKPIDYFTWEIPESWTLEEAATVPVVYSTVYAAFFIESHIKKGKTILIHAGSGGVGLAAIQVALSYGLEVFTTVSTTEKKEYLLQRFPTLNESHIGNSRDTSFYNMVMHETNGDGVDYVLNSLSDEKLITSLRCVAEGGHFLEIGKYDIVMNTRIGLGHFSKNITFHTIMLDQSYSKQDDDDLYVSSFLNWVYKKSKSYF